MKTEEQLRLLSRLINRETDGSDSGRFAAARGQWPELVSLAAINRVIPPLAKNATLGGFMDDIPSAQRRLLLDAPKRTAAANLLILDTASDISDSFSVAGIHLLPLKGISFIDDIFSPDERELTDADFLIRREDLDAAESLLSDLGFSRAESELPEPFELEYSGEKRFIAQRAGSQVDAEMHWDVAAGPAVRAAFSFNTNALWRLSSQNEKGFKLNAEGRILFHIFHLAVSHSFSRLQWLLDLHYIIRSTPPDWQLLEEHIRSTHLSRAAGYTLMLLQDLFGTQIPHELTRHGTAARKNIDITARLIYKSLSGDTAVKRSGVVPLMLSERRPEFVLDTLFPPQRYLEMRYPDTPKSLLYFYRPLKIVEKMFSRQKR